MPRTEAVVNRRGPADRVPSAPGSFLVFLVLKPCSFNQPASWLSVVVPQEYMLKSSVTTGPSFFDPHLASAIGFALMDKRVPVEVANVAVSTCTDKANRHDRAFFSVVVDELPIGQHLTMHQHSGADGSITCFIVNVLGDKPLRELPGRDTRLRRCIIIRIGRWAE